MSGASQHRRRQAICPTPTQRLRIAPGDADSVHCQATMQDPIVRGAAYSSPSISRPPGTCGATSSLAWPLRPFCPCPLRRLLPSCFFDDFTVRRRLAWRLRQWARSKIIPGTCDNYDSSDGKTYRSLCAVVAVVTDGTFAIPIDKAIWTSAEFNQTAYAKKWELAKELITKICDELPIYMVLADGLYAIFAFLTWLISKHIKFEMRFHANRVINDKGIKCQIKASLKFVMSGKRPKRTIKAKWYGVTFYFTALRRVANTGTVTVIYQISNYKASAREHVQAYGYRWNIEKFFRTAKQKLGLNDCQSHKLKTQENHISNVFFIYALLQVERKKNNLKNIETVIKQLNHGDFNYIRSRILRLAENFGVA